MQTAGVTVVTNAVTNADVGKARQPFRRGKISFSPIKTDTKLLIEKAHGPGECTAHYPTTTHIPD